MENQNQVKNQINRIEIKYNRVIKTEKNEETNDIYTWNYKEYLSINRESNEIQYVQEVAPGCILTQKYMVEDGIVSILDDLDSDKFFKTVTGYSSEVFENENDIQNYEIKIEYSDKEDRVIKGSFDKMSLPTDWDEFANRIDGFISFYRFKDLFNEDMYSQIKRLKTQKHIYCKVSFGDDLNKLYYYRSEDPLITKGDIVVVPVGDDNNEKTAFVEHVEYYTDEDVPLPLNKTKFIIKKQKDSDYPDYG